MNRCARDAINFVSQFGFRIDCRTSKLREIWRRNDIEAVIDYIHGSTDIIEIECPTYEQLTQISTELRVPLRNTKTKQKFIRRD